MSVPLPSSWLLREAAVDKRALKQRLSRVGRVAVLAGGTTVALRAIFSLPAPFPAGGAADTALMLLAPATSTALLSPIVFTLVQRIDQNLGRKREESPA